MSKRKREMLGVSQVAAMCGVTTRTVNRWIRAGYFPGTTRPPGRTSAHRIPKDEVEKFIAEMSDRVKQHYRPRQPVLAEEGLEHPEQQGVLAALAEILQQFEAQRGGRRMLLALIVEDDEDAAEIFEFTLKGAGLATSVVRTGGEALTWLGAVIPDVIVLDLHLPNVPGTEVLRRMRGNPQLAGVPVIVATAHPELAEEVEEEANLVLIKPVRYTELRGKAVALAGGLSASP